MMATVVRDGVVMCIHGGLKGQRLTICTVRKLFQYDAEADCEVQLIAEYSPGVKSYHYSTGKRRAEEWSQACQARMEGRAMTRCCDGMGALCMTI
jgi:hypothetical protein